MLKKIMLLISIVIVAVYFTLIVFSKPTFFDGLQQDQIDKTKPRILLVSLTGGCGGLDVHVIKLYTMLRKHGYYAALLVPSDTKFPDVLQTLNLPYYTTNATLFSRFRPFYHFILKHCLYALCKKEHFDIIHCNNRHEAPDALNVKKSLPIKVFFTRHMQDPFAVHQIKNIDAVIAVSPFIESYFQTENHRQNLNIGTITYLPPLFDTDKFFSYSPKENRQDFFKNNFNIAVNANPVITMIAHFYFDLLQKNHQLLLQTIKILVQARNKNLNVMLAGDGPSRAYIQNLSKELGIEQYIHFLGSTDKIPELLYHSDVFVLTSKKEAFGIAYLEAGLMKKPAIGATETGAQAIIIHEKTGLLFKNNDAEDLANQIERLLDNPELAKDLGQQAYKHVMSNFLPETIFKKYCTLYETL